VVVTGVIMGVVAVAITGNHFQSGFPALALRRAVYAAKAPSVGPARPGSCWRRWKVWCLPRPPLPDIGLNELALPTDLPVSLPSDLVRQRPDILAAEAQLRMTNRRLGLPMRKR